MNDDHLRDSVRYLIDALSAGGYGGPQYHLYRLLAKLNIKSAQKRYSTLEQGAPLIVEDLQTTMKEITFDLEKIKLHRR